MLFCSRKKDFKSKGIEIETLYDPKCVKNITVTNDGKYVFEYDINCSAGRLLFPFDPWIMNITMHVGLTGDVIGEAYVVINRGTTEESIIEIIQPDDDDIVEMYVRFHTHEEKQILSDIINHLHCLI